jgi:hypothetical protein
MERFSLRKLNKLEGEEQYQIMISNRFTALGNFGDDSGLLGFWTLSIIWYSEENNVSESGSISIVR